jgi:hypothetical protein
VTFRVNAQNRLAVFQQAGGGMAKVDSWLSVDDDVSVSLLVQIKRFYFTLAGDGR